MIHTVTTSGVGITAIIKLVTVMTNVNFAKTFIQRITPIVCFYLPILHKYMGSFGTEIKIIKNFPLKLFSVNWYV